MTNIINPVTVKDDLYYQDLIYELRKLAKLNFIPNDETEKRIEERKNKIAPAITLNMIPEQVTVAEESEFEMEIFVIVQRISKNVGVSSKGLNAISKHRDEVEKEIRNLESQMTQPRNNKVLGLKHD